MLSGPHIVVLVTVPNADVGAKLARSIIESGLAACVNIIDNVRSIYVWKGKVEEAGEALLVIKTRVDRFPELVEHVRRNHPYEVPEVIAIPIIAGLSDYLRWIDESVVKHA